MIPYHGKRGTTWRIKFVDADGRQVMETLGSEHDGWDERKAERALGAKLAEIERGLRKPRKRTFGDLVDEFVDVTLPSRGLKKSTLDGYKSIIRNHLRPEFADDDLSALSRSPEHFDRYVSAKLDDGLSAKTIRNHLVLLGLIFKMARRWRWVSENPLELVDPPRSRTWKRRRSGQARSQRCCAHIGNSNERPRRRMRGTGTPPHVV